jgi:hypothetical protein
MDSIQEKTFLETTLFILQRSLKNGFSLSKGTNRGTTTIANFKDNIEVAIESNRVVCRSQGEEIFSIESDDTVTNSHHFLAVNSKDNCLTIFYKPIENLSSNKKESENDDTSTKIYPN